MLHHGRFLLTRADAEWYNGFKHFVDECTKELPAHNEDLGDFDSVMRQVVTIEEDRSSNNKAPLDATQFAGVFAYLSANTEQHKVDLGALDLRRKRKTLDLKPHPIFFKRGAKPQSVVRKQNPEYPLDENRRDVTRKDGTTESTFRPNC